MSVEVHISCDRTDPPVGRLSRVDTPRPPQPPPGAAEGSIQFTGWLGLLRALADTLGDPGHEGPEASTS
jgi:hypothetical protein